MMMMMMIMIDYDDDVTMKQRMDDGHTWDE